MIGQTYGRLTVRNLLDERGPNGDKLARCECECGTEVTARVTDLKHGRRVSCGCGKKYQTKRRKTELSFWKLEEQKMMDKTAAHQQFLSTYRPNGGDCGG